MISNTKHQEAAVDQQQLEKGRKALYASLYSRDEGTVVELHFPPLKPVGASLTLMV